MKFKARGNLTIKWEIENYLKPGTGLWSLRKVDYGTAVGCDTCCITACANQATIHPELMANPRTPSTLKLCCYTIVLTRLLNLILEYLYS